MADYFTEREKAEAEYAATNTVRADYISRQAAINEATKDGAYGYISSNELENLAAADVQPVRHGHWIDRNGNIVSPSWERYECSECGARSDNKRFCHNCGARMDEGSSNV